MKLKQIIFIIFIGISTLTSGQNITLSFSSTAISLPDTISMGDTTWYHCWIVNEGNSVITDHIALRAARICQAQGLVDEREIGHINPGALYPGDSIELPLGMMHEIVHQQNYLTGDNIVVIWPRVQTTYSQDNEHVTTNIHILNSSMISSLNDDVSKDNSFYLSDNTIHLQNEVPLSQVFLYNMIGNQVYQSNSQLLKKINIQNAPNGTYLLVMYLLDGTIMKEKLIIR